MPKSTKTKRKKPLKSHICVNLLLDHSIKLRMVDSRTATVAVVTMVVGGPVVVVEVVLVEGVGVQGFGGQVVVVGELAGGKPGKCATVGLLGVWVLVALELYHSLYIHRVHLM